MEFRGPIAIKQAYESALLYLTQNLADPQAGKEAVDELIKDLGPRVQTLPRWHPVLYRAGSNRSRHSSSIHGLDCFKGADHTVYFVRGFVTCPYSDSVADTLVEEVRKINGLHAYRLNEPLYSNDAYPVVVESYDVTLEADGTIASRNALAWFLEWIVDEIHSSEVAETWWNLQSCILGDPHGSRSSICVNQYVGRHMRKILETLNESGVFGPILETSLAMLSKKNLDRIGNNLIRSALASWDNKSETTSFPLRGEDCVASIRDTFGDEFEFSIAVRVGNELFVSGFYYPKGDKVEFLEPTGSRKMAEKFI